MRSFVIGIALAGSLIGFSCHNREQSPKLPAPNNGIEIYEGQVEGEGELGDARERYEQLIHHTPDSADWQLINQQNLLRLFVEKRQGSNGAQERSVESFANGSLTGEWSERGSQNQAGSLRMVDYKADEDKIYGVSDGGSIFRGNLDGSGWEVLEDDLQFDGNILQVVPNGGGKRILCAIGKQIWYSDDEGSTWSQSGGLNYYDNWGSPMQLIALNDGNAIYFLVFTWNQSPWGSRIWLMYSNDKGATFSHIHTFPHAGNYWAARHYTKIWSPYNSNELYAVHTGTNRGTYSVSGNTVTLLNSTTTLPENSEIRISGFKDASDFFLYTLVGSNTLYKSSDAGANWNTVGGTLPVNAWNVGIQASPFDSDKLFFGAVDCYRSYDQGLNWTMVNIWWDYYGNTDYLHADIMDIRSFEKTDGTKFMLIGNHGGLHVSYDYLSNTSNIGLLGLNISQYYDTRTDPTDPNYMYSGSQDQGHQRASTALSGGPIDYSQVISGDYGEYSFSENGTRLWTVYPFGAVQYRYFPKTGSSHKNYDIPGSTPPAGDWIFPTAELADAAQNKVYVAGGNLSGGSGSYLITLSALSAFPWTVTGTQFGFDFNAASGKPISAIAASTVNNNRLFVATENGKLYYSNNQGSNWTAATNTGMSAYINCVLPSRQNADLVWMSGNGYSGPGVVQSTDGGQTFTGISAGLPATQVRQIAANTAETLLFAATDAGPYVYVVADNQWYSMIGSETPIQSYRSVEFVAGNDDIVRFSTYGRGVWDFQIQMEPAPLEWLSFTARQQGETHVALDWETANEQQVSHFEIERSADGTRFLSLGQQAAQGGGQYFWTDKQAPAGVSYYRIRQLDLDGTGSYSPIRRVVLPEARQTLQINPNPITERHFTAYFEAKNEPFDLYVWDYQGRRIAAHSGWGDSGQVTIQLPSSTGRGPVLVQLVYRGHTAVVKGMVW
jgi:photosystem II stability/assembly factor-like uncharacterized protein